MRLNPGDLARATVTNAYVTQFKSYRIEDVSVNTCSVFLRSKAGHAWMPSSMFILEAKDETRLRTTEDVQIGHVLEHSENGRSFIVEEVVDEYTITVIPGDTPINVHIGNFLDKYYKPSYKNNGNLDFKDLLGEIA